MTVAEVVLGLLEGRAAHGYELKRGFDAGFSIEAINFGQIYSTLERLRRDGFIEVDRVEQDQGPDRIMYRITREGTRHLEKWLIDPDVPRSGMLTDLYPKLALAVLSGRSTDQVLDVQRSARLTWMKELTAVKRSVRPPKTLLFDYLLFHLEADLRWIEHTRDHVEMAKAKVDGSTHP